MNRSPDVEWTSVIVTSRENDCGSKVREGLGCFVRNLAEGYRRPAPGMFSSALRSGARRQPLCGGRVASPRGFAGPGRAAITMHARGGAARPFYSRAPCRARCSGVGVPPCGGHGRRRLMPEGSNDAIDRDFRRDARRWEAAEGRRQRSDSWASSFFLTLSDCRFAVSEAHQRGGHHQVVKPMFVVATAVEPMGRTVVRAGLVAPRGIGTKVQQQGPTPQP